MDGALRGSGQAEAQPGGAEILTRFGESYYRDYYRFSKAADC